MPTTILFLPVSTRHVSIGALLGIGASSRQATWRNAGEILLARVTTVPGGAVFAAFAFMLVRVLRKALGGP